MSVDTGTYWYNPDCADGKHRACRGDAWNLHEDRATPCECECHEEPRP